MKHPKTRAERLLVNAKKTKEAYGFPKRKKSEDERAPASDPDSKSKPE